MSATEVDVITAAKILKIDPRSVRRRFKSGKIAGRFVEGDKGGGVKGRKLIIRMEERNRIEEGQKKEQDKSPAKEGALGERGDGSHDADHLPSSPPNIILYAGDHIGSPLQKGARGSGRWWRNGTDFILARPYRLGARMRWIRHVKGRPFARWPIGRQLG